MALRNRCGVARDKLQACDINGETLATAEESRLIRKGWNVSEDLRGMFSDCDLVFLCLKPSVLIPFLEQWGFAFKSGALVTDIAGTKGKIAAVAEKFREDVDFIPGHPMAGAEKGGFANAGLCNFIGKNYILTPLARNKPENLEFLKNLIRRMGFGRVTEVSAEEHDRKIAFTSQLCHVIASALIDCEADSSITRFGGGSFEDLTRIAMIDAPLWTELFIDNRTPLLESLGKFSSSLAALESLINCGNSVELERRLALVRDRRMSME
jgi:prephenate dehydrogenase